MIAKQLLLYHSELKRHFDKNDFKASTRLFNFQLSKRLSSNSSFNLTSSPSGSTPGTVTAATDFSFEPAPPHPSGFTTLQHPKQGSKGHEGPQEGQPRTTRSNSITTRAPEKPTRTSSSLPPEAVLANLYTQHERNEHER